MAGIDKETYSRILTDLGFTPEVVEYLWDSRSKTTFHELTEERLKALAGNTTQDQKRYLETVAARWRAQRNAAS